MSTYAKLALVFAGSMILVLLPISDTFRGIASLPGAGALLGALYQLYRDQKKRDHDVALQASGQAFELSVACKMAEATFEKHSRFCEDYFRKLNDGIQLLLKSGPASDVGIAIARELRDVRDAYSPWLSKEIEDSLFPVEQALTRIGVKSYMLSQEKDTAKREELVNDMFRLFGIVCGIEYKDGKELNEASDEERRAAANTIREELRNILGTKELAELRSHAIRTARRNIGNLESD